MNERSLLYNVLEQPTIHRLKFRLPWDVFYESFKNFNLEREWRLAWENSQVANSHLIDEPTKKVPGFDLSRIAWKNFNRIRTNCGRCNYCLNKWNILDSKSCPCEAVEQTISHIICFCPDTFFAGDLSELHDTRSQRSIFYLNSLPVKIFELKNKSIRYISNV